MALKNLPSVVRTLGNKANPSCVSTPGKWNSCESPSGTPIRIPGNGEEPPPFNCCDFLNFFQLGTNNACENRVDSSQLSFPPIVDCNFDVDITFLPDFPDRTLSLFIYLNGNPIQFTPGITQTITIPPNSSLYAQAETGSFYIPNEIFITAINTTCGIDYGVVGSLNLWRSMECSIYPLWSIPGSLVDNGTTLFSSTYQYTGGANPIYLETYVNQIVFNQTADIFAYIGPDPNPTNNPYYPLVSGGAVLQFPAPLPLNPGDYFTLYHDAGDGKCSIYQLEIYNRCPGEGCEQYFLIEEFIVNRANCGA